MRCVRQQGNVYAPRQDCGFQLDGQVSEAKKTPSSSHLGVLSTGQVGR